MDRNPKTLVMCETRMQCFDLDENIFSDGIQRQDTRNRCVYDM